MHLAHDRSGAGEPLLLLHGVGHGRAGWTPVVDRLAAERDVVVADLPGHGASPDLDESFRGDPADLTAAVEDFVAGLGIGRPHVAGNSLGGLIALQMAARGSARSVTALSPAGFWSGPERVYARAVLAAASAAAGRLPRPAIDRLLRRNLTRAALVGLLMGRPSRHDPAALAADLTGLGHPREAFGLLIAGLESWELPAASAVRTTIGWGSRDLLLPRRQLHKLQAALPDARVYVLPGCGHVPMGDDPGLVADLVLAGSRD